MDLKTKGVESGAKEYIHCNSCGRFGHVHN